MNDIFIAGETIDLHPPNNIDMCEWANWFNDKRNTKYLDQGIFPNTSAQQQIFLDDSVSSGRWLTMIKTKDARLLGVASLSAIDWRKRSCQISTVTPKFSKNSPLAALEARSLAITHAFDVMGLERVWSGNVYPGLKKWIEQYQVLGFLPEGLMYSEFVKGHKRSDCIRSFITYDRFRVIKNRRSGNIWLGNSKMFDLIRNFKKNNKFLDQLKNQIEIVHSSIDNHLLACEKLNK